MDNKVEILLGSEKNVNSVNVDNYQKIELTNNISKITEFTVNDVVNSTEVFDAERNENQVYRIYGRIEWMSLLNGLKSNYSQLKDYFNPQYTGDSKNLINSFDFYLVAPSPFTGTTYGHIANTNNYRRSFRVIAGKEDIEIYDAGFTNNVYGEQVYSFNFKSDFDVSEYYDKFGFPLTELFLYAQYKPVTLKGETMSYTTWSTSTGLPTKSTFNKKDLVVGDDVEGNNGSNVHDIIEYIPEEYFQEQVEPQQFYIRTSYNEGTQKWLEWVYNPFIPFRLRYFDGVVSTAKLAEIVENTTTLDVYMVNSPSQKINATKTLAQTLSTSSATVNKWNDYSTSTYNWNANNGELEFTVPTSIEYSINFTTQIYLPTGTDKYIGEIYLEEYTGTYSWNEIPNTRRKFLITNSTQSIKITRSYSYGDAIRARVRLIPNPYKRTMFIIPDYATMLINDGKYVWRDILPQGYVDPITNLGVDYPFFNKRRYLFSPIVFDVIPNLSEDPDLEHPNTQDVFTEIEYYKYATSLEVTPETELDNIGKPCQ